MGFNVKHLNKYFRWVKQTGKNYLANKRVSGKFAKLCLDLDVALLRQRGGDIDKKAKKKHDYLLGYLRALCPETLEKYGNLPEPEGLNEPQSDIKVWSMWWQGEENADKLFRMCIDSARRETGCPVTVLDKDSYKQYFKIPAFILDKYLAGNINPAHICDYMVVSILAEQGGFFTGATVWCSQPIPERILRAPFYVCKAETESTYLMSRSRWVGYLLGGKKEFPLFGFARDFLNEYWSKMDYVVDYLLLDYIFELAYQTVPCVKRIIDENPDNNLLRNELIGRLGDEYDEEQFKRFTEGDTMFYKLSWKFGSKDTETVGGKLTNYGYMLDKYLQSKRGKDYGKIQND